MCALLDQGSTVSFVTPLVARKFYLLREILHEPCLVSTPIDTSLKLKQYIKIARLMFLIESPMITLLN